MYIKLQAAAKQLGIKYCMLRTGCITKRFPATRTNGASGTWLVEPEAVKAVLDKESSSE